MHLPHARRHSGTHGGRTGGHNHNLVVSSAFDRQWWIICSTGDAGGSCRSNSTWRPPTNLNASSSCSLTAKRISPRRERAHGGGRCSPFCTHSPRRPRRTHARSGTRHLLSDESHERPPQAAGPAVPRKGCALPSFFLKKKCGHKLQIFTTRRSKLLLLLNLLAF